MHVRLSFDPSHQFFPAEPAVAAHNDDDLLAEARPNGGQ
jgi:hypothetical protein